MPPRSKVITMLPEYIRQEVERRLFENGFRDYQGLAQWVRGQAYEISDDSLWRLGRALQQLVAAAELTVRHARALAQLGEDYEGLTANALITLAQQKALETLLEIGEVKPADLNAVANLTRAAIAQQRWAAELKSRGEQPQRAADKPEDGTQNAPPQKPSNTQLAIAPLHQPASGGTMTVKAERSSPAVCNSGGDNDRRSRETRASHDGPLAAPGDAAAASLIARYRGSPRIKEVPPAPQDTSA